MHHPEANQGGASLSWHQVEPHNDAEARRYMTREIPSILFPYETIPYSCNYCLAEYLGPTGCDVLL